ncbi:double-strand break repair helicase AddA [Methylocapsa acidiphila]|uniref:double-strand break repair helicase AddA n=1 Tax=Methylocapsa acidiphila TaxID=133552 RepID=UPI000417CEC7|nr:double-strand break repair helicase AddA [Methylocapsa acidiphila]
MALSRIPPHTLKRQHEASNPAGSVWVSAHAGSGKTHVLTQRVMRLLLQGAPPAKILCLTYTKAAAANMAGRVFERLAGWTGLSDAALREAIIATGAPSPQESDLSAARRLFARAVETPGGLKIQTIHAFCERLLHLFPFEANVPSRFEVVDDARQAELLSRARREILVEVKNDQSGLGASLARVSDECGAADFQDLLREALARRADFKAGAWGDPGHALRKALGVEPGQSVSGIEHEMIEEGLAPTRWSEIAAFLESGKKLDQERARLFHEAALLLRRSRADADLRTCLSLYLAIFFNEKGAGDKTKSLLTKGLAGERPEIAECLYAEQERLDRLRALRKAAATLERSLALTVLVDAILSRYETMKAARGLLDFDDLIAKTSALLERSDARWVLYKLDAGIEHILLDEAQDTSAAQWRILEDLTGDFAVGDGRGGAPRTFFAVGDEKQSIFSFQGAAPDMFGGMRRKFERKFGAGAEPFAHVRLSQSFRSTPGVLSAVDRIFEHGAHRRGLVADDDVWMPHEALKESLPGLVEIWPLVGAQTSEERRDWRLPLDLLDARDPAGVVAERIAQKIARLIAEGSSETVHDSETGRPRPVRAGDVMILVRKRDAFFEAVIRALKQSAIPVAGADRLELAEHIAVLDLIAAGRAALRPEDDLTLACVLKSPLIGLDDDDLLAIAPGRVGSLSEALAASSAPAHIAAVARLARWRDRAALSPFAFYSSLLGEEGGRRALEGRLGPEAGDAIDEFLRLALDQDSEAAPSLVAFLDDLEAMDCSIRRDMEAGLDVVRVMTVHAAKGLEAKIVFLPDICSAPSPRHDARLFGLDAGGAEGRVLAWSPRKDADCPAVAAAREAGREAAADEYRRLFYVALTRAEERLYIAGFHGATKPSLISWGAMIEAAFANSDDFEAAPAFWSAEETILRRVTGVAAAAGEEPAAAAPGEAVREAPDWLWRAVSPEPEAPAPIRPSSALAAADRLGAARLRPGRSHILRRGSLMHVLLQYLPDVAAEKRRKAARAFLAARADDLDEGAREEIAATALDVIEAADLGPLFGPSSRAEVAIAGRATLAPGLDVDVVGQVDRIAETERALLVVDFKTGAPCASGETPAGYLAQMALYRAVLAPLWPGKPMRMLLIWTAGPRVVALDDRDLDAALASLAAQSRRAGAPRMA